MKLLLFTCIFPLLFSCLVLQKDTYKEELQNIKAEVGESVTISCSKPEVSSFSAAWSLFPGNENLTFHKRYKDRFTNNSLNVTITNLTKEDSGVYCCAVKTVKKTLKRFIMLQVIEPCSSGGVGGEHQNQTDIPSYIPYGVIVLQTCIIFILLVMAFRRPRAASTSGFQRQVTGHIDTEDLKYAEIIRPSHPRVIQSEEKVTYALISRNK
ncbi:uncharacterized protein [Aquarana catesbeiana]|uniref:uncharacterized protein n=1 Tax=Aquarana catesbeiana TaxID=8400 RepID=UPI003CCA602B